MFILHDDAAKRELYTRDHPSLRGRVMFVRSDDKRDDGAAMVLDSPRNPEIPRLVKAGYLVRTRADSDLRASASSNEARREAALASGAQIVSTDFPAGEPQAGTGYIVQFTDSAPGRIDPINGPPALRGQVVGE